MSGLPLSALLGGTLAVLFVLLGWLGWSRRRGRAQGALASARGATERARAQAEVASLRELVATGDRERAIAEAGRAGAMAAAPGPLFVTDVEGWIIEANEAAAEAFALDDKESRNIGDLMRLPPSVEPAGSGLAWHLSSGNPALFDRRVEIEADGKTGRFVAELAVRPVVADGRRLFAIGLRDLSMEKKAARELERLRHLRTATIDSITEGILSVDIDGRITSCNRRFLQMWGMPASLEQAGELARMIEHIAPQLESPEAFLAEMAHVQGHLEAEHDGVLELVNQRTIEHSTRPFLVDGQLAGRVWTFRDVTDRKRSAESLGRFADIVQNMQIGLLVYQLEIVADDRSLRVITVNPAACRMLGLPSHEIVGRLVDERFPRLRDRGIPQLYASVARGAGPVDLEDGLPVAGGGRERAISMRAFSLPGRSVGVAIEDITERRAVARLKSEFISTVSHELRTPLTSIRGSLGLLQGGVAGALPEAARALVEIAQSNSERLLHLINDILDVEKLEDGKLEMRFVALACDRLVCAALASIAGMAEAAGVRLSDETAASAPQADATRVSGDEERLVDVLKNLLSNAIKFSAPGGEVRVRLEARDAEVVRFVVSDRGPGIAEDQRTKIFGKFQQLDSSDTRQKGGTGLGLAISKAIVERHGGVIGVDSTPGEGSSFWFELPAARRASASATSTSGPVAHVDELDGLDKKQFSYPPSPERIP